MLIFGLYVNHSRRIYRGLKAIAICGWGLIILSCSGNASNAEVVRVTLLDGSSLIGNIVAIRENEIAIKTDTAERSISFAQLEQVRPEQSQGALPVADEQQLVMLTDSSRIVCRELQGKEDRWTAKIIGDRELNIPERTLEAVRFRAVSTKLESQWQETLAQERTGDQLVIVRPEDTVDVVTGVLGGIAEKVIDFSFDGQAIQAPQEKLLGVIWYRPRNKRIDPAVEVVLRDGSTWQATEIKSKDSVQDGLAWTTRSGVSSECAWSDISSINFAVANVVWLASQPVLDRTILYGKELAGSKVQGRNELLGPRFVSSDGEDLAKSKDLRFLVPSEIAFRIGEGFNRFTAKVHRMDKATYAVPVICEVIVGTDVVWKKELDVDEMEATAEVAVEAGKRIGLRVRCESKLPVGTEVTWEQPRLTK